jgi:ribonuclease Z
MGGGARELVVLGTSAQVPTRERSQNGYLLRWDDDAILFDPGEGTQRQLLCAEVSPARLSAICITHFHGDHCLGLPGVLSRFVLDRREEPVDLYFPASGATFVERLRRAAVLDDWPHLRLVPVPPEGGDYERRGHRLVGRPLRHSVDTIGWRIEAPERRNLRDGALDPYRLTGLQIGRLVREGRLDTASGTVRYEDVSELHPGQRFAFIMDTGPCDGALELAADADLLVTESTFLTADAHLARDHLHLTARDAGRLANEAGARRLVVTHFSARSPVNDDFAAEAGEEHGDVVAAHDLARVPVPAAS